MKTTTEVQELEDQISDVSRLLRSSFSEEEFHENHLNSRVSAIEESCFDCGEDKALQALLSEHLEILQEMKHKITTSMPEIEFEAQQRISELQAKQELARATSESEDLENTAESEVEEN